MFDKTYEIVNVIAKKVYQYGGEAFYVGGCVRDKIMGLQSKDIDIEVHRISPDTMRTILKSTHPYSEIGKSFGIFSLCGYPVDIALPRKDIQTGVGHRGFDIEIDPFIGLYNAAKRRDFTINSIMQNILTGEIIDSFDGISDINKKVIRHTCTETFAQDPLRVLRAAQFASRLGFDVCEETVTLSKKADLSTLSVERVCEETRKALLNSEKPSVYFEYLKEMNQLFPWFEKLHFSGKKWKKTMKCIDNAALHADTVKAPFSFMLSAASSYLDSEDDVRGFIKTLTNDNSIMKYVTNMFKHLSLPLKYAQENCDCYTTNKMFDEVIDKEGLILLVKSAFDTTKETETFLKERLSYYYKIIGQPSVTGKDLIEAGFLPGEKFSHILARAHDMHLMGIPKKDILANLKTDEL